MAKLTEEAFDREVLKRLPLAEATWKLWQWIMQENFLQGIWDRYRGRCYDKFISFPLMVSLITEALIEHVGVGRPFQPDDPT